MTEWWLQRWAAALGRQKQTLQTLPQVLLASLLQMPVLLCCLRRTRMPTTLALEQLHLKLQRLNPPKMRTKKQHPWWIRTQILLLRVPHLLGQALLQRRQQPHLLAQPLHRMQMPSKAWTQKQRRRHC